MICQITPHIETTIPLTWILGIIGAIILEVVRAIIVQKMHSAKIKSLLNEHDSMEGKLDELEKVSNENDRKQEEKISNIRERLSMLEGKTR